MCHVKRVSSFVERIEAIVESFHINSITVDQSYWLKTHRYVCCMTAGGNSKTAMIAALSPADINYEETLSTLRYVVIHRLNLIVGQQL